MAFSRVEIPEVVQTGTALTRAMVGIGMLFAAPPAREPNIEDTLLGASLEGVLDGDLRVVSVLLNWLAVHHPRVNADRLIRSTKHIEAVRVRAFWAAVGYWLHKDRRLSRLKELYEGPRVDLLHVGTGFQIQRKGEDPRLRGTPVRVPASILRERASDVLKPFELARLHSTYRERIRFGPTYRADMWAELLRDPEISPADLAHRTYGSYGTAWEVMSDFQLLRGLGG
jgi:hypothetical protein